MPPPIPSFKVSRHSFCIETTVPDPASALLQDMKLPKPLLDYLKKKKIEAPTPIQLQGIPVA